MSRPGHLRSACFLAEFNYDAKTQRKYAAAVSQFAVWCDEHGETASTYDDLDDILFDYMHYLYTAGLGRGLATATLYGIVMYEPRARDHLMSSRLALRGWAKRHPPTSYPPLTWELTVLISTYLVRIGHLRVGVALLVGFDCLLRVGELARLRREDVVEAGDPRVGAASDGVWLRITKAKTGRNQLVCVFRPHVATLVHSLLAITPRRALLFDVTADALRRLFKRACSALGLSDRYVPHSLRHGGATWMRMTGSSVESILERGRWASVKSARTYINSGRAMLMSMSVPPHLHAIASVFAANLLDAVTLAQRHGVGAGQSSKTIAGSRKACDGAKRHPASAHSFSVHH